MRRSDANDVIALPTPGLRLIPRASDIQHPSPFVARHEPRATRVDLADIRSAAQIFLRSNALLTRPLEEDDIKRRLLGHWGTCPGLNFAYAHTTSLISELEKGGEEPEWIFVTGVSLACLRVEGGMKSMVWRVWLRRGACLRRFGAGVVLGSDFAYE